MLTHTLITILILRVLSAHTNIIIIATFWQWFTTVQISRIWYPTSIGADRSHHRRVTTTMEGDLWSLNSTGVVAIDVAISWSSGRSILGYLEREREKNYAGYTMYQHLAIYKPNVPFLHLYEAGLGIHSPLLIHPAISELSLSSQWKVITALNLLLLKSSMSTPALVDGAPQSITA